MGSLILLASLAAAGYATYYLGACAIFPFGSCRRCDGTGKLRNPFSRRMFRLCPRCDGTGRRVRIGRRVYEHFRREHRNGTRGTR
ncbi:hypothetical protein ACQP00_06270 [Dactylosporangium sp. CS-047395]|uniref:hypothetical protein n=1 Tax=Dactylosporangium sp. CS-047395 TaxID=3239936 RepID=UPI003D93D399